MDEKIFKDQDFLPVEPKTNLSRNNSQKALLQRLPPPKQTINQNQETQRTSNPGFTLPSKRPTHYQPKKITDIRLAIPNIDFINKEDINFDFTRPKTQTRCGSVRITKPVLEPLNESHVERIRRSLDKIEVKSLGPDSRREILEVLKQANTKTVKQLQNMFKGKDDREKNQFLINMNKDTANFKHKKRVAIAPESLIYTLKIVNLNNKIDPEVGKIAHQIEKFGTTEKRLPGRLRQRTIDRKKDSPLEKPIPTIEKKHFLMKKGQNVAEANTKNRPSDAVSAHHIDIKINPNLDLSHQPTITLFDKFALPHFAKANSQKQFEKAEEGLSNFAQLDILNSRNDHFSIESYKSQMDEQFNDNHKPSYLRQQVRKAGVHHAHDLKKVVIPIIQNLNEDFVENNNFKNSQLIKSDIDFTNNVEILPDSKNNNNLGNVFTNAFNFDENRVIDNNFEPKSEKRLIKKFLNIGIKEVDLSARFWVTTREAMGFPEFTLEEKIAQIKNNPSHFNVIDIIEDEDENELTKSFSLKLDNETVKGEGRLLDTKNLKEHTLKLNYSGITTPSEINRKKSSKSVRTDKNSHRRQMTMGINQEKPNHTTLKFGSNIGKAKTRRSINPSDLDRKGFEQTIDLNSVFHPLHQPEQINNLQTLGHSKKLEKLQEPDRFHTTSPIDFQMNQDVPHLSKTMPKSMKHHEDSDLRLEISSFVDTQKTHENYPSADSNDANPFLLKNFDNLDVKNSDERDKKILQNAQNQLLETNSIKILNPQSFSENILEVKKDDQLVTIKKDAPINDLEMLKSAFKKSQNFDQKQQTSKKIIATINIDESDQSNIQNQSKIIEASKISINDENNPISNLKSENKQNLEEVSRISIINDSLKEISPNDQLKDTIEFDFDHSDDNEDYLDDVTKDLNEEDKKQKIIEEVKKDSENIKKEDFIPVLPLINESASIDEMSKSMNFDNSELGKIQLENGQIGIETKMEFKEDDKILVEDKNFEHVVFVDNQIGKKLRPIFINQTTNFENDNKNEELLIFDDFNKNEIVFNQGNLNIINMQNDIQNPITFNKTYQQKSENVDFSKNLLKNSQNEILLEEAFQDLTSPQKNVLNPKFDQISESPNSNLIFPENNIQQNIYQNLFSIQNQSEVDIKKESSQNINQQIDNQIIFSNPTIFSQNNAILTNFEDNFDLKIDSKSILEQKPSDLINLPNINNYESIQPDQQNQETIIKSPLIKTNNDLFNLNDFKNYDQLNEKPINSHPISIESDFDEIQKLKLDQKKDDDPLNWSLTGENEIKSSQIEDNKTNKIENKSLKTPLPFTFPKNENDVQEDLKTPYFGTFNNFKEQSPKSPIDNLFKTEIENIPQIIQIDPKKDVIINEDFISDILKNPLKNDIETIKINEKEFLINQDFLLDSIKNLQQNQSEITIIDDKKYINQNLPIDNFSPTINFIENDIILPFSTLNKLINISNEHKSDPNDTQSESIEININTDEYLLKFLEKEKQDLLDKKRAENEIIQIINNVPDIEMKIDFQNKTVDITHFLPSEPLIEEFTRRRLISRQPESMNKKLVMPFILQKERKINKNDKNFDQVEKKDIFNKPIFPFNNFQNPIPKIQNFDLKKTGKNEIKNKPVLRKSDNQRLIPNLIEKQDKNNRPRESLVLQRKKSRFDDLVIQNNQKKESIGSFNNLSGLADNPAITIENQSRNVSFGKQNAFSDVNELSDTSYNSKKYLPEIKESESNISKNEEDSDDNTSTMNINVNKKRKKILNDRNRINLKNLPQKSQIEDKSERLVPKSYGNDRGSSINDFQPDNMGSHIHHPNYKLSIQKDSDGPENPLLTDSEKKMIKLIGDNGKTESKKLFTMGGICCFIFFCSFLLTIFLFKILDDKVVYLNSLIVHPPTLQTFHEDYKTFFLAYQNHEEIVTGIQNLRENSPNYKAYREYTSYIAAINLVKSELNLEALHIKKILSEYQGLYLEKNQAKFGKTRLLSEIQNIDESTSNLRSFIDRMQSKVQRIKNHLSKIKEFKTGKSDYFQVLLDNFNKMSKDATKLIDAFGHFFVLTNRLWATTDNIYEYNKIKYEAIMKELNSELFKKYSDTMHDVHLNLNEFSKWGQIEKFNKIKIFVDRPTVLTCDIFVLHDEKNVHEMSPNFDLTVIANNNIEEEFSGFKISLERSKDVYTIKKSITIDTGENIIGVYAQVGKSDIYFKSITLNCYRLMEIKIEEEVDENGGMNK